MGWFASTLRVGRVITYDRSDGLVSDDFERTAGFRDPGGELFFGTNRGLIVFNPAEIKENPYVPPVYITSLELENQPVAIGSESVLQKSDLTNRGSGVALHKPCPHL